MDKEKKDNLTPDENAYDPDAAELLKDLLNDDDDDDFQTERANSHRSQSLVNILTSSSGLEAIKPAPAQPAQLDLAKSQANAPDENEASKTVKDLPAVDAAKDNVETPHNATIPMAKAIKLDMADSPAKSKPAEDAKPSEDFAKHKLPSGETVSAQIPAGKRPPGPPPKPSMPAVPAAPAPVAAPRQLADNEIILSKETLYDMLPGGKNDEARDLAVLKFPDTGWYANAFNEDYLRTIPKSTPSQTIRESRFIIDRLGIQSGARVLDLCCGFGRHTIELASKGFDMVGLDLSMVMLKKALADAQARNQAIKFVHGDMRKLAFKAIFDAIYCVQTSFGYFDDHSNFKVMQGIFNALKPGGAFLIETINRDFLVNDLPLRLWWKGVDCMLLEEIDIEHISGVLKVKRSYVFEDQRPPLEQNIQIRLYSAIEMRTLLVRAGFNVCELSGDYSLPGAYFGATSPRNIFVAEKPVK